MEMGTASDKTGAPPVPDEATANYSHFVTSHYSPNALLIVIAGFVVYHIAVFSCFVAIPQPGMLPWLQISALVLSCAALCMLCIIWTVKVNADARGCSLIGYLRRVLPVVQAFNPVLVATTHAILAFHLLYGSEDTEYVANSLHLNLALSAIKIYPILTYFLLRDTWHLSIALSWFLAVATGFSCAMHMNRTDKIAEYLTYSISSALLLQESIRQDQSIFCLVSSLKRTLERNKQLAVEAQALELRVMIGNVAHDLNTVSRI
jgi:hypothetical protein